MPAARRVIAIGGGKGGVGKSLLCANLAIAWARQGRRVIAVDADLGGANLHTCLGVEAPRKSLSHFVRRSVATLPETLTPTPISGLSLISGARDPLDAGNPAHQQKMRLLRHLTRLDCDVLLIDLGAGSHFNVLDFFLFAELGVVVVTPEPTSEDNATRFLKAAFLRQLKRVQRVYGFKAEIRAAVEVFHQRGLSSPRELVQCLRERSDEVGSIVEREIKKLRPALVINQCREPDDRRLGPRLRHTAGRTLGVDLQLAGALPYDEAVYAALRRRQALLIHAPDSEVARALIAIGERLIPEHPPLPPTEAPGRDDAPKPPAPLARPAPEGSYDGPMLKVLRLARGLDLRDLSARTKIPLSKLQAIEDDDASAFAAPVYLRGFVQQYARALGLDGDRVARAYLSRLKKSPSTGNH